MPRYADPFARGSVPGACAPRQTEGQVAPLGGGLPRQPANPIQEAISHSRMSAATRPDWDRHGPLALPLPAPEAPPREGPHRRSWGSRVNAEHTQKLADFGV